MFARKTLLTLSLPLLIGGLAGSVPALAQIDSDAPPATSSADATHPQRHHDLVARAQRHLDWLKMKLQITPQQEQQWSAFADTVLAQAQQMQAERAAMGPRPSTAPERIDWQLTRMKERTARFEAVAQAAKDLYASLTPEQQQIADKRLLSFRHRHRA